MNQTFVNGYITVESVLIVTHAVLLGIPYNTHWQSCEKGETLMHFHCTGSTLTEARK